jgi:hypothetical protein
MGLWSMRSWCCDRTSYARGTDAQKTAKLEDDVDEAATRLAGDVDLFGEGQGSVQ